MEKINLINDEFFIMKSSRKDSRNMLTTRLYYLANSSTVHSNSDYLQWGETITEVQSHYIAVAEGGVSSRAIHN